MGTAARKAPKAEKPTAADDVIVLKITLRGIRPPIWRRLEVSSRISLSEFHDIIQAAMGWQSCHLYAFEIGGRHYGDPENVDDVEDDTRLTLAGVVKSGVTRLTYKYDFGDGWEHDIIIERKHAAVPGARYPVCVAGKRNCPPEDCGGIWGYRDLVEALADPSNESHAELSEWVGADFDPEKFSSEMVNARIKP
jgi:hypothetical protein